MGGIMGMSWIQDFRLNIRLIVVICASLGGVIISMRQTQMIPVR